MNIRLVVAIGMAGIAIAAGAAFAAGQPADTAPAVSRDEIEVYDAVLASWLGDKPGRQLVDARLSAPPSRSDSEFAACTSGLEFPSDARGEQGRKTLVGARFARPGVEVIDGSTWRPVDPGRAIAMGKSVDEAVEEGFANSLISFSQIAFSRDGTDAVVKFSMVCGGLCGSGSTFRLHKSGGRWSAPKECGGGWIS